MDTSFPDTLYVDVVRTGRESFANAKPVEGVWTSHASPEGLMVAGGRIKIAVYTLTRFIDLDATLHVGPVVKN